MAKCPKCGRRLTLFDWKPNCPECGINLVYYGMDERLMDEADAAEAEHARTQKHIDRLKASFIGSKLTIIRIVLSILPIAALMLPLCSVTYSGPFIEQTTTSVNAISIYNLVSSLDFDALITMLGSNLLGTSFIGYAGSLVCLLLSLVMIVLSLLMLMMACGPKGNPRNITLNVITLALAIGSVVLFNVFSSGISAAFPEFISASMGFGIFVYIGTIVALLAINIIIAKKGVVVKYKPCFVGGIPADEYFELVKNGTPKEKIREMMVAALSENESEAEKETAEAK